MNNQDEETGNYKSTKAEYINQSLTLSCIIYPLQSGIWCQVGPACGGYISQWGKCSEVHVLPFCGNKFN